MICLHREGEGNAEEVSEKSGNTGEGADSVKNRFFEKAKKETKV